VSCPIIMIGYVDRSAGWWVVGTRDQQIGHPLRSRHILLIPCMHDYRRNCTHSVLLPLLIFSCKFSYSSNNNDNSILSF